MISYDPPIPPLGTRKTGFAVQPSDEDYMRRNSKNASAKIDAHELNKAALTRKVQPQQQGRQVIIVK
jgi:hypothetical protein